MRIAFDQQIFLLQEFGGISRYICSLSEALSRIPDVEARIFAPLHFNGHLQQMSRPLVFGRRVPRVPKTFRPVRALSERIAHRAMGRFQPDIVHETYFSKGSAGPRRRRVITVYDMIAERYPSMFPGTDFTEAKRESVFRADRVLCISESTRRDLIDLFGVPEARTSVVYLGYDRLDTGGESSVCPGTLAGIPPFLLYVGSRGGYKNFESLLRAYAASGWLRDGFAIVCFGGGALAREERELIDALRIRQDRVVQLGGGDDVLADLYRRAVAFVYPSLYEGFGIPPLEAMSLDCPVLCSDTSSIPEVVGDAGEYFAPEDVDSMRFAIESVLQSRSRQNELIAKGRARCAAFNWERCARETHDIYRSLL